MRLPMGRSASVPAGRQKGRSRDAPADQIKEARAEEPAPATSSSKDQATTTQAAHTSTSANSGPVKVGTTLAAASSSSTSSSTSASAATSHSSSSSAARTTSSSLSTHTSFSSSATRATSSDLATSTSTSASLIFLTSFAPDFPVETASAAAKTSGPDHVFVTNQLGDSAIIFALFWVAGLLGTIAMIRCTRWTDGRRGRQVDQMISDDMRWAEGREVFGERKVVWEGGTAGGTDEAAGLLDGPVSMPAHDAGRGQRGRAPLGPSKLRR